MRRDNRSRDGVFVDWEGEITMHETDWAALGGALLIIYAFCAAAFILCALVEHVKPVRRRADWLVHKIGGRWEDE